MPNRHEVDPHFLSSIRWCTSCLGVSDLSLVDLAAVIDIRGVWASHTPFHRLDGRNCSSTLREVSSDLVISFTKGQFRADGATHSVYHRQGQEIHCRQCQVHRAGGGSLLRVRVSF